MAAIRYVSSTLAAGSAAGEGASGALGGVLPPHDTDDDDIAKLGTSFRDPRRIVS